MQKLLSLDVASNRLECVEALCKELKELQNLRILHIGGNPLCLENGYASKLSQSLGPNIRVDCGPNEISKLAEAPDNGMQGGFGYLAHCVGCKGKHPIPRNFAYQRAPFR